MTRISRLGVIALALGLAAGSVPMVAQAQSCPPGYYFASDGQCYPGAPPPVYDPTPPVYQPPVVFDGLALGVGIGALIGGADGGRGRGGPGRGGPERGGPERGGPERGGPGPGGNRGGGAFHGAPAGGAGRAGGAGHAGGGGRR